MRRPCSRGAREGREVCVRGFSGPWDRRGQSGSVPLRGSGGLSGSFGATTGVRRVARCGASRATPATRSICTGTHACRGHTPAGDTRLQGTHARAGTHAGAGTRRTSRSAPRPRPRTRGAGPRCRSTGRDAPSAALSRPVPTRAPPHSLPRARSQREAELRLPKTRARCRCGGAPFSAPPFPSPRHPPPEIGVREAPEPSLPPTRTRLPAGVGAGGERAGPGRGSCARGVRRLGVTSRGPSAGSPRARGCGGGARRVPGPARAPARAPASPPPRPARRALPRQPRASRRAPGPAGALGGGGSSGSGSSRARCDPAPGPLGAPARPAPGPMELLAAAFSAACAVDHDSSTSESDARDSAGHLPGSESSSTPGNGTTPEDWPALADSPTTLTQALQMIHPIPADSWRILIEQIGLLYQEYRDKSTLQEIEARRKQDAEIEAGDDGSPASEEAPEEEEEEEEAEEEPASTPERKTLPQICLLSNPHSRFNLWQDLPEIRSSGVLDILQPEEIKLQEAMFELVTSEASYYKSLNLLVSHFVDNERLKKLLHPSEAHILFSNVLDVMAVSERFLLELERRMEESIVISDVCDIVHRYAADHFSVYITYVSNQTYQERTYKQLLQEKAAFRELITQLELDPKCKGLPLSSFLILPFQRITRLKLLVQNILKRVEERSERECTALDAHKELEMVVKACNEGVRKMSRTEQMVSIQKKMEFKIKSVPIISHSRWLLKQGELQQMSGPKTSRTLRTKKLFQEIYLFLFNDLLLICRQIPGDKFQVFDSAPRGLLRVEELEDQGQTLANVFILRLLENADDREATYMLKATSQSEMKRWMTSLAPNRRTKFVSFTSRLLDCPQVQCVHPYVAQQPDELTLELADILNILEKTEDGWIFGERLHDQERGWFPSSMTEEILNPKIRSQNLKECFRVHKMDDPQRSQNKDRRKLGSRNRQ